MSQTASTRKRTRSVLGLIAIGLLASAAIFAAVAYRSAPSFSAVVRGDHGGTGATHDGAATDDASEVTAHDGAITEADGFLPDGVTVFDDTYPGIAALDPDLVRALREAAADAAHEGIKIYVNSGWRSPEYQNQLRQEAVSEYGSEEEAARWVATATTSAHVSGDAVDIGGSDAIAWLSEHGAEYGLCRTYRNEPWHYELRPEAASRGCPSLSAGLRPRSPTLQR